MGPPRAAASSPRAPRAGHRSAASQPPRGGPGDPPPRGRPGRSGVTTSTGAPPPRCLRDEREPVPPRGQEQAAADLGARRVPVGLVERPPAEGLERPLPRRQRLRPPSRAPPPPDGRRGARRRGRPCASGRAPRPPERPPRGPAPPPPRGRASPRACARGGRPGGRAPTRPPGGGDRDRRGRTPAGAPSTRGRPRAPRKRGAVPSRSRCTSRGSQAPARPVHSVQPTSSAAPAVSPRRSHASAAATARRGTTGTRKRAGGLKPPRHMCHVPAVSTTTATAAPARRRQPAVAPPEEHEPGDREGESRRVHEKAELLVEQQAGKALPKRRERELGPPAVDAARVPEAVERLVVGEEAEPEATAGPRTAAATRTRGCRQSAWATTRRASGA